MMGRTGLPNAGFRALKEGQGGAKRTAVVLAPYRPAAWSLSRNPVDAAADGVKWVSVIASYGPTAKIPMERQ
jgi:hypothetical protein